MLLWLTEYLSQHVSGFAVFQYLTFRTMVSVMTALFTSLLIGPYVIAKLADLQLGQERRFKGTGRGHRVRPLLRRCLPLLRSWRSRQLGCRRGQH